MAAVPMPERLKPGIAQFSNYMHDEITKLVMPPDGGTFRNWGYEESEVRAITYDEQGNMTDLATELNQLAWEFAGDRRYRLALDVYDRAKSHGFKLSAPHAASCGFFLLCLERHQEALAQFREAAAQTEEREGAYIIYTGVAQWLMGRHRDAVVTWRRSLSGFLSGTIVYTDFSGRDLNGLLLWYAAVTLKDDDLLDYTIEFFHETSTSERPSTGRDLSSRLKPPAYSVPGAGSVEAFLLQHFGDKNVATLLCENDDIVRRRELVTALFYLAVKRRADGQEQECEKLMSAVVQIENPVVDVEWYLARAELPHWTTLAGAAVSRLQRQLHRLYRRLLPLQDHKGPER